MTQCQPPGPFPDSPSRALRRGYAICTVSSGCDLYPIQVPWLNVGVALLVVALVAMLGAGLSRSSLPIERRL